MSFRNLARFPRPHLIDQLGRGAHQLAPLSVVLAPSGYGKSALLRQWVDAAQEAPSLRGRVSWAPAHTTNTEDAFWRSVAAGVGLPNSRDPKSAVERWAKALTTPYVVVVDSYEAATTRELDVELVRLLRAAPNLHLLLAATRVSSLLHPLQTSQVDLEIVDEESLRLTRAEAATLANEVPGVTGSDISSIYDAFGGWPLGVRAGLLGHATKDFDGTLWHFGEDLCASLDSVEAQLMTCAIAVCPGIDCRAIGEQLGLDPERSAELGEELLRSGLVTRREGDLHRYECRPGLLPSVSSRGAVLWDQTKLAKLKRQHALETADVDPIGAVTALIDIGEYAEANRVVALFQATALRAGSASLAALRKVPLDTLREYPQLLLTRLTFERPNPNFPIETVEELVRYAHVAALRDLEQAPKGKLAPSLVGAIVTGRMSGSWDMALALSRDTLRRLESDPNAVTFSGVTMGALPFASMASAAFLAADFDLARKAAEEALRRALDQGQVGEERYARSLLANVSLWQSNPVEAEEHLEKIDEIGAELLARDREGTQVEAPTKSPSKSPGLLWVEAEIVRVFLAVRRGDMETAQTALDRLIPLMDRMEQWPVVVLAESEFLEALTGFHHAHAVLERRVAAKPEMRAVSPFFTDAINARRATFAMGRGRFEEARELLRKVSPSFVYGHVPLARLALLENDLEGAYEAAERGLTASPGPWRAFELSLIHAVAGYRKGVRSQVWESLLAAVQVLRKGEKGLLTSMVPFQDLVEVADAWVQAQPDNDAAQFFKSAVQKIPEAVRVVRHDPLTPAELQTLNAMLGTTTTANVADKLHVSANTVKFHQRSIYQKLGVNSRSAALAKASQIGLLD